MLLLMYPISKVLATGEEFQQVENADFYTAGPTVNVGTLFDHTRIVQIHANAALLLSPGERLDPYQH